MLMPSDEIVKIVAVFASAMTAPSYAKALTLVIGTILTPGRRTVSSVLRVLGLDGREHARTFMKYHRVLNRDRWSPWVLSEMLLSVLITTFVPAGQPLIVLMDDTLERRPSGRIRYVGCFRDAARSGLRHLVTSFGIRWVCLALVVQVPWSVRRWALPFMVVPTRSKRVNQKLKRPHRTVTDWAERMIVKLRRWQPEREIVLVADRTYATVALVQCCQRLSKPIMFVTTLRLDAGLYDEPCRRSKFGPPPRKGAHQPSPQDVLADPKTPWRTLTTTWYGGQSKTLRTFTRRSIWTRSGASPVGIRWVLVTCPDDVHFKPTAFLCSDPSTSAAHIVASYILRWNIEVTFEEARAHLGFETQRQWSVRAIERTTPCLLGIFSLVVVLAKQLHPHPPHHPNALPAHTSAWYDKPEPTYVDALAAVRLHLWQHLADPACSNALWLALPTDNLISPPKSPSLLERLRFIAAYA